MPCIGHGSCFLFKVQFADFSPVAYVLKMTLKRCVCQVICREESAAGGCTSRLIHFKSPTYTLIFQIQKKTAAFMGHFKRFKPLSHILNLLYLFYYYYLSTTLLNVNVYSFILTIASNYL